MVGSTCWQSFMINTLPVCQTESWCLCIPGCYGVDPGSVSKEWKCARCKANAMTEVSELPRLNLLNIDLLSLDRYYPWRILLLIVCLDKCLITCSLCRIAVCVHWEVEPYRKRTTTSKLLQCRQKQERTSIRIRITFTYSKRTGL